MLKWAYQLFSVEKSGQLLFVYFCAIKTVKNEAMFLKKKDIKSAHSGIITKKAVYWVHYIQNSIKGAQVQVNSDWIITWMCSFSQRYRALWAFRPIFLALWPAHSFTVLFKSF